MDQKNRNDILLDLSLLKHEKEHDVYRSNNLFARILRYFGHQTIDFPSNNLGYKTVQALGLKQKYLRRLKKKFDSIDIDHSGSIEYHEFFEVLDEKQSPFTDSLFKLVDADNSGRIEFCEFVSLCATYCIYSKEDILRFCFDYFDKDGSGTIDELEYKELCETINRPAPMFPGNFTSALTMLDSNNDGLIDFDEFVDLDRRYPLLLFPAFRLQQRMQMITLGEKTWVRINEAIAEAVANRTYMNYHGGKKPYVPFMRKIREKIKTILGRKLNISLHDLEQLKQLRSHH